MKKIYLTLLILSGSLALTAQTKAIKDADEHFAKFEFEEAIEEYNDIVEDGEATPYVYKQLARAHFKLQHPVEAESYYAMIVNENIATADDYYRYAQLLKTNNKPEKSKVWMEKLAEMAPNDPRAESFRQNPDYVEKISQMPEGYTIDQLEANSGYIDFGGHLNNDKLYFVSARNESRKNYEWNNQPTLDIYVAEKIDSVFGDPEPLRGDVNSKYNEGTVSLSEDGKTLYFTRNDYLDGDYGEDEEGIGQLKIYTAHIMEGEWGDIQPVPFNDSEYSTGHTAFSPDGEKLYFSSDMPGGFGQSDLYVVEIQGGGNFGEPQNLGSDINTPGKESFPFIAKDGTLYFSSTGHLGLGGMDIFYAQPDPSTDSGNGFGEVKNMGAPVNSPSDDFAFTYYPEEKMGFVSSNRKSPENDDIYILHPIEECTMDVIVKVVDEQTGEPIEDAQVKLYSPTGGSAGMENSAQTGKTSFTLPCDTYEVQADAEGYFSNTTTIPEGQKETLIELKLPPEPEITETEVILNPIFFEFDKADITPQAATELDRLVRVMQEHPEMKIEVRAHTDSRGSDSYNLNLSDRRAKSTTQYIISQGIDESRITGKGFGETMPEVNCAPDCTDEQRAKNRRSEFRIIGD